MQRDLRDPLQPGREGDPVAAEPDLLPLDPHPGGRGVVQHVQLAVMDVGQPGEHDRLQLLDLAQQQGGLGQRLRPGQVGRHLRAQLGDRLGSSPSGAESEWSRT